MLEKVVPLEDPVLVAVHEACAGLDVELRVFLLDLLQLSRGIDSDVPASGLLADRFMIFLHAVDAQGHRDVETGTLVQNSRDIRDDALLNLSIRHQIDRFQLVVPAEGPRDFRQVLAGKGFAARDDQYAEIGAQGFADALQIPGGHLEFLALFVVQLVREEAVDAAHVAHGRDQDIEKDWRERSSSGHPGVPFEYFFMMKIHIDETSV